MRGAREGKKQRLVTVSQRFLSETVVILVLNLPSGQVLYFAEIQITEGL